MQRCDIRYHFLHVWLHKPENIENIDMMTLNDIRDTKRAMFALNDSRDAPSRGHV